MCHCVIKKGLLFSTAATFTSCVDLFMFGFCSKKNKNILKDSCDD